MESYNDLELRLKPKKMTIKYDLKLLTFIAKKVYNPEFWAREVRRFVTEQIEDKIAQSIIEGEKKIVFTISHSKTEVIVS